MTREIQTDMSVVEKTISSIGRAGKKMDADIQTASLAVSYHAHKHGDVTLLNKLYLCMPKGTRHIALAHFLLSAAPVTPNTNRESKAEMPFVYLKEKRVSGAELERLMAEHDMEGNQWYDRKPSPAPDRIVDVRAMILRIMHTVDKAGAHIKGEDVELVHKLHEVFDPLVKVAPEPSHA